MILSDEESMHFYWFFMYILLNWQYKLVVDLMFMTWAILNTCEWFDYITQRHPGVPIVPLFSGLVQIGQDNAINALLVKNYTELVVVGSSLLLWTVGWCAPICGVILAQAIRIKFLNNSFTKEALKGIDAIIKSCMPGFVYDGMI